MNVNHEGMQHAATQFIRCPIVASLRFPSCTAANGGTCCKLTAAGAKKLRIGVRAPVTAHPPRKRDVAVFRSMTFSSPGQDEKKWVTN
jgi:hypothetical protein